MPRAFILRWPETPYRCLSMAYSLPCTNQQYVSKERYTGKPGQRASVGTDTRRVAPVPFHSAASPCVATSSFSVSEHFWAERFRHGASMVSTSPEIVTILHTQTHTAYSSVPHDYRNRSPGGSQISPTVLSRQMPVAASARRGSYVLFPPARTRFYGAAEQGVRLASSRAHLPLHSTHRTPRHPRPRHGVELDRNRSSRLEKSRRRWGGGMQGALLPPRAVHFPLRDAAGEALIGGVLVRKCQTVTCGGLGARSAGTAQA
jgi:hypothetical protein